MTKLTLQEAAHARSVGDETVMLAPIPPEARPRILIGSVCRKQPAVIKAFLQSLAWQRFRKPVGVDYFFITDFAPTDAYAAESLALLKAFTPNVVEKMNVGGDFSDVGPSHTWTPMAWHRVGALKNEIIQRCLDGGYDALWLVDADVLCDPFTLQSLADCEAPIVAGVYWTQWIQSGVYDTTWNQQTFVIHAAPQVWLRHPYQLDGHGLTEADFRKLLVERQLVKVGGLGACTLFHRAALAKGVSFAPIPEGLPQGPMADGEDRHLCERARRLHLPLLADAWPDIYHAYHANEYGDIPTWLARLEAPHKERADIGDLISYKLEMNEPVPQPHEPNRLSYVGPQYGRGRMGALGVLPEIEEALASMLVGERRILHVHYPSHYDYATLRGQSRVITVHLLDVKPFGIAPVIDREQFVGNNSKRAIDATTLTDSQMGKILALSEAK